MHNLESKRKTMYLKSLRKEIFMPLIEKIGKIRRIRKILCILTSAAVTAGILSTFSAFSAFSIFSANADAGYTLKICEQVRNDQTGTNTRISGSKISVSQVAQIKSTGGYEASNGYESLNINMNDLGDTEKQIATAKKLSSVSPARSITRITAENGEAIFSGLEKGIYLVREVGKTGDAKEYTAVKPYLVSVPEKDGQLVTTVCPKVTKLSEISKKKQNGRDVKKEQKKAKKDNGKQIAVPTGDLTNIALYLLSAFAGAFVVALTASRISKRKERSC